MLTIDGLVSGIDTATIIEGLLEVQQRQIGLLETRRQDVLAQQTAFRGVEARLLSFRSVISRLTRTQNGVFSARSAAVSDESAISAAASSGATVGAYSIRVNSLAQANQIAAQGFADPDSIITEGTLTLQVGAAESVTITVDSTNNTLQGLADTINAADAGVSASIINDGSGGATPYRLLLSAQQTGADNAIALTNNLAATAGGATRPDFDLLNPVQAATNSSITLGSGPGAITIENDANVVDNVIPGVTISLLAADPAKTLTLSVTQDTETPIDAVEEFVDGFNGLMEYIDQQVRYDAETEDAGLLLGNRDAVTLQDSVRRIILDVVPNLNPSANRLTSIGVSVTDNGRLTLDRSKLEDAVTGRLEGVTADDVRKLFALTGESDNPQVQFLLGSTRTNASGAPYQVDITQAAERAEISAASALAASTVIDATNNTLDVTVDGASATITLTAGTYTATALAAHLEEVISGHSDLPGRSVTVSEQAGVLSISSVDYGISSSVAVTGGTALGILGFTGTESDNGQDVAGTFIVDGVNEPATGRGRLLIGNSDNDNTADMQLRVTLTSAQVTLGVEAGITVTRGLASQLDQLLDSVLDPISGRLTQVDDSFDQQAEDIQESIDRQQLRFDAQQQSLIEQFVALESAIQELQTTSSFLSTQLAGIASFNRSAGGR